jgi:hypothetical protein
MDRSRVFDPKAMNTEQLIALKHIEQAGHNNGIMAEAAFQRQRLEDRGLWGSHMDAAVQALEEKRSGLATSKQPIDSIDPKTHAHRHDKGPLRNPDRAARFKGSYAGMKVKHRHLDANLSKDVKSEPKRSVKRG